MADETRGGMRLYLAPIARLARSPGTRCHGGFRVAIPFYPSGGTDDDRDDPDHAISILAAGGDQEHFVEIFRTFYGPTHKAFAALDEAGQRAPTSRTCWR